MRFISTRPISLILSPFWKKKQRKEAFYPPRYFRRTNELILQLSVNCLKRKLGNVWSFSLQIIKRKTTSNMEDIYIYIYYFATVFSAIQFSAK